MSGPRSVETLQPFNVSVTDGYSVHHLVNTLQVWRQAAQLQQVTLGHAYLQLGDTRETNSVSEIKTERHSILLL